MRRIPTAAVPVAAVLMGLPTLAAPDTAAAQVTYTAAFGALVVFAWLGVRRRAGRARVAHGLIAGALTCWLAGDLLYWALTRRYGELGDVSAADVLWVAGYPLLAAGMVLMVRLRAPGRVREAALDALAMSVAVAALVWQFMIAPEIDGPPSWGTLLIAFYPFGDVLLFAAAALVVLAPGRRSGPTAYLLTALTLTLAGDVAISVMSLNLQSFDTARLDPVLLLANAMFAAALWHPDAAQLSDAPQADRERLHLARVIFLGVSLLTLPVLSTVHVGEQEIDRLTTLTAMGLLTGIVLSRFMLVVREQERARDALAYRASHDQLTGAVNRQELHARLTTALQQRGGSAPTVHYLDLNGFKPINDRYGHAAGDHVLVEVAARLRTAVPEPATVARIGGDEFVVLSEAAPDPEALTGRIRQAVTVPLRFGPDQLNVGVSIGCAVAIPPGRYTCDSLLAEADANMYRDKIATRSPGVPAATGSDRPTGTVPAAVPGR